MAITRAAKRVGAALLSTEIIKQIATIRGEFQQLEVVFTTLLQSKSKANALMSEMVTLAAKTPFDLKGVAHGARQLLAYGFAADDITGTLTRLGNVAAGLRLPLERLTYLYGTTMTQGRLYARDMMQFTTSGIPMLQEMAKMYGKSTDEINAMVSAGEIGFEDVKKVIENMTNSGGKFHNLMEEQSKIITGQISNLGDAIDVMFDDMGKSQEGVISGAISGATYLVENYEKVLDILIPLAATYGVYKAALIAVAAAQSAAVGARYADEIVELQSLLTAKQANKNADVEAAVAKGTLTQAQAKNIIAIRAEVSARLDAMKIEAAQAAVSVTNAKNSVVQSGLAISASRAKIAALREELATQVAAGEVGKACAVQEKINAELKIYGARQTALKSAQDQLSTAQTSAQNKAVAANTLQVQINAAATKSLTASQRLMTGVSILATNAVRTLKAALASFLPMAIIAAVGALVYKLYEMATAETEVEKAQNKLNDSFNRFTSATAAEQVEIDRLFGKLDAAKKGTKEYDQAKQAIVDKYGAYLNGLSEEIRSLGNVAAAYEAISTAAKQAAIDRAISDAKTEAMDTFKDSQTDNFENLQKAIDKKIKNSRDASALYQRIIQELNSGNELSVETQKIVDGFTERITTGSISTKNLGTSLSNPFSGYINIIKKSNKELNDSLSAVDTKFGIASNDYLSMTSDQIEGKIAELKKQLAGLNGKEGTISLQLDISKAEQAIKTVKGNEARKDETNAARKIRYTQELIEAEKKLKEVTAPSSTASEKEQGDAKADVDRLRELLGLKKKAATAAEKAQQEITDAQIKNILAAEKEKHDLRDEGLAKDLERIRLDKEAKIAAINQEEQELKKKYKGKEIPKDQQDLYTARRDTAGADAQAQATQVEAKYADEVKALYAQIGDVFLSGEERKRNGIKETYDQYRKQLKQKLDGGEITQAAYDAKLPAIDAAQKQAELKPLLDQYQSYADQRKQIEDKFNDDIASLRTQAGEASTAEEANRLNAAADLAKQKMGESIASLDIKTLKDNIDWDSVFGDLSKSSTASISHTLEQVQQLFDLNKGNMSAEDIRDMTQAIEQMQNELAQRNPFGGLAQSFKAIGTAKDEVIAALTEYKESYSALTEAQHEYNAALLEQQALELEIKDGSLSEDSEAYAQAKDKVAIAADKQSKAEQRCVNAETKAYSANNKLSRSYATFTSRLGAVHSMVSKVGANAKDLAEVFDSDVADKIGKALGFIDEVIGATTDVLDEIGKVSSRIANSIATTVSAASQGVTTTTGIAVTSMSTMEKASVILAVISAALQIATAIASLFNNDKAHQEEIDALQERIKQLQWELDNMEVGRLKNNDIDILKNMRDTYAEVTKEVLDLHRATSQYASFAVAMSIGSKYQNEIMTASVDKLAAAYLGVEYTKNKALGGAKYKEAQDALENMAQQQLLLQRSIEEESSKSKEVNGDQIADWEREIQELGAEAIEMINEMVEDIIGGSSSDIAEDLGSAFIEAFQEGEDAARAWGDKVNDIVADIMKRMLIQQFLEKPLGKVFDKYKEKWFGSGGFSLDTVINSMGDFANDLMTEGDKFKDIWNNLPDNIKDMFKPSDEEREASQKGFAAMSQDTAEELDGRFTAIQGHTYSMNESLKLMQPDVSSIRSMMSEMMGGAARQLMVMQGIETNTRSLVRLERIESDMGAVKTALNDINLKGIKLRPQ